jgi:hypothetical protein
VRGTPGREMTRPTGRVGRDSTCSHQSTCSRTRVQHRLASRTDAPLVVSRALHKSEGTACLDEDACAAYWPCRKQPGEADPDALRDARLGPLSLLFARVPPPYPLIARLSAGLTDALGLDLASPLLLDPCAHPAGQHPRRFGHPRATPDQGGACRSGTRRSRQRCIPLSPSARYQRATNASVRLSWRQPSPARCYVTGPGSRVRRRKTTSRQVMADP